MHLNIHSSPETSKHTDEDIAAALANESNWVDPRCLAAPAPYSSHPLSMEELEAIGPDDHVKVLVNLPWETTAKIFGFEILSVHRNHLRGTYEKSRGVFSGESFVFPRHMVGAIDWHDPDAGWRLGGDRGYWQLCRVSALILAGLEPISEIWREEVDPRWSADDLHSGFTISGPVRSRADARQFPDQIVSVPMGRVLNVDDSWLDLTEADYGCHFVRDPRTGRFCDYDAVIDGPRLGRGIEIAR